MTRALVVAGTRAESIASLANRCAGADATVVAEEDGGADEAARLLAAGGGPVVVALAPWEDFVRSLGSLGRVAGTSTSAVLVVDAHRLAARAEAADAMVLPGSDDFPFETARGRAIARALAPGATFVYDPVEAVAVDLLWRARREATQERWRDWRGNDRVVDVREVGLGGWVLRWQVRRPLHPGRLHEALEDVWDGVVRGRGTVWTATRPDVAWRWDQVRGDCRLEPVGAWLADGPEENWQRLPEAMQQEVRENWHPYFGDRSQLLRFVGFDSDPRRVASLLDRCALTDDELAAGRHVWKLHADPFAGVVAPDYLELVHIRST